MSAEKQSSRAAPLVACTLFVLLVLPTLYVLSIGPAFWLSQRGYLSDEAGAWFYWPLSAIANSSEFAQNWLIWYIRLFEA